MKTLILILGLFFSTTIFSQNYTYERMFYNTSEIKEKGKVIIAKNLITVYFDGKENTFKTKEISNEQKVQTFEVDVLEGYKQTLELVSRPFMNKEPLYLRITTENKAQDFKNEIVYPLKPTNK